MREVEDDRCGGNMGKWKFTQKLNGQVKCGSAAPGVRHCRSTWASEDVDVKWLDFRVYVSGDFGLEFEHLVALLEQC
jgi:hypothetical protein